MNDPKTIELDGMRFQMHPMPALKALRLDRRLLTMLIPVLEGVTDLSADAEIDLGKLAAGINTGLDQLSDTEFVTFMTELLSTTIYLPNGGSPIELDEHQIDQVFQTKLTTLYTLAFEVARYLKFTPFAFFAVGTGGGAMRKIRGLFGQPESGEKTQPDSAKSGSSTKSSKSSGRSGDS